MCNVVCNVDEFRLAPFKDGKLCPAISCSVKGASLLHLKERNIYLLW